MLRRTFLKLLTAAGIPPVTSNTAFAQTGPGTATPASDCSLMENTEPQTGYAPVNGLEMYYEIHGSGGTPLVLLHGAFMSINSAFGQMIPALSSSRQVIAAEFQGHARTADIDRPLTWEQLADDVAALIRHLGLEQVDVFGYSLGGGAALQLTIRHPGLVRKLVAASAAYSSDGYQPGFFEMIGSLTPELFAGTPVEAEYKALAPNPEDFPVIVEKMKALDMTPFTWPREDIRSIAVPTFIIFGDNDVVTLEQAVEMYRLLGGGVNGDIVGMPSSRLAVIPAASHIGVILQPQLLLSIVPPFLDAPAP